MQINQFAEKINNKPAPIHPNPICNGISTCHFYNRVLAPANQRNIYSVHQTLLKSYSRSIFRSFLKSTAQSMIQNTAGTGLKGHLMTLHGIVDICTSVCDRFSFLQLNLLKLLLYGSVLPFLD